MSSPLTSSKDSVLRTGGYDVRQQLSISRQFTPNFTEKLKKGTPLPPLGYTRSEARVTCKVSEIVNSGNVVIASPGSLLGVDGVPDASASSLLSVLNGRLARQFYARAKSAQSSIGVSIAEAPRTINLIAERATRIARAMQALKRFDVRTAFSLMKIKRPIELAKLDRKARSMRRRKRSSSKWAAKTWLEVQYGWKPLLAEVYNAAEDLASRQRKVSSDIYISVSGRDRQRVTTFLGGSPAYINQSLKKVRPGSYVEVRSRIQCRFRVADQGRRTANGLGLTNVASLAWEMLPWSFVVDWFVPVGDFLNSLSALSGLTFIDGIQTTRTEKKYGYSYGPMGRSSAHIPARYFRDKVTWEQDEYSFSRTVLGGPPSVGSVLRLNSLDKAFGLTHCTNALALMRTVFGR
jgi:hypothetical protein